MLKEVMERLKITVRGTVQGVGFRPFVYGLATSLALRGYVANTSGGVTIEVEGEDTASFLERLRGEAPPLSSILSVDVSPLSPHGYEGFRIIESSDGGSFTLVSPDVSVCGDCLREMCNPGDRRYRYPFINCTNCGPRYSITKRVPYDRPNTTMAVFRMCPECEAEYHDPLNRRFHAQPNACPVCGPRLALYQDGLLAEGEEALGRAMELLLRGAVVAVKGLGGYHLACDAKNESAVASLRERKRKSNKPFALMAGGLEAIKEYCRVSEAEEALLLSPRRPIVLLEKKRPCPLPEAISPGNNHIGFMLPYTPLHHLIMEGLEVAVMTSGNLSEEPIQVDNEGAREKLSGLADAFLAHDRDIFMRVDDSVVKHRGGTRFVRRSRGFAPEPIVLSSEGPDVLAAGADLKNTFALLKGGYAILSQHIGDMENYETLSFFEETLKNLKAVYRAEPVALAYDLHPGYLSSRWALEQAMEKKLAVQHHHAHVASVMAEKGLSGKVIGVALDGIGYGADGALWGGEFLVADALGFRRAGHFRYVPLPGGERAVREPWRAAVSYVREAVGHEAPEWLSKIGFMERYGRKAVEDVLRVAGIGEFSPRSSGAGRLFDAVSAILGVCGVNTFEGEAAMALEAVAATDRADVYPLDITFSDPMEVDFSFSVIGIIKDLLSGRDMGLISAKFHNTVVEAIIRVAVKLSQVTGITTVALSGGVFQNDYLLGRALAGLRHEGLQAHCNELVPLNDGGVSLGQAYVLREKLKSGEVWA